MTQFGGDVRLVEFVIFVTTLTVIFRLTVQKNFCHTQKSIIFPLTDASTSWGEGSVPRSLEDETRNGEKNANRNPEWWGDFSQPVKIEKIKFLGILRHKVELRF